MITHLFLQFAIATAPLTLVPPVAQPAPVVAAATDQTALDILNNTRSDILRRGAIAGCPVVKYVYVDGELHQPPPPDHGFSTATVYIVGDMIMVLLPPAVADILRSIPASSVQTITYVDCTAIQTPDDGKNALYISTKQ